MTRRLEQKANPLDSAQRGIDRYIFLAGAIAGRRVSVNLSAKGDLLAYTDGRAIIVPARPSVDAPRAAPGAPAQWLEVAAQALLIAAGSLDVMVLPQLIGQTRIMRRYLVLEVCRAANAGEARLPQALQERIAALGVRTRTSSARESLSVAKGRLPLPAPPDYFGVLRPVLALGRAALEPAAPAARAALSARTHKPVRELEDDEAGERSTILRLLQNPLARGNPLADLLNRLLGAAASRQPEKTAAGEGDAELPIGRVRRAMRRGIHAVRSAAGHLPADELHHHRRLLAYPEWNEHRGVYRRDWAWIEEVPPWRSEGARELRPLLTPPPRALRRQLAELGLEHQLQGRQPDGSDLDTRALIDHAIELRSGAAPANLDVFRANRRTRRSLGVVIALDISGSTAEAPGAAAIGVAAPGVGAPGVEAPAAAVTVFDKQLLLAHHLGVCFDGLGASLEIFGFHSWGRKLVHAVRIKGHEERWSAAVDERFGQLEPVGFTRTGAAIRHAAMLLGSVLRAPHRLLIVITDGFPYDQDYEAAYAEGDTRKALQEARDAAIAGLCLSVGSSTETRKLAQVFGSANILAVEEVADVTRHIRPLCAQALAAAAAARRVKRLKGRTLP